MYDNYDYLLQYVNDKRYTVYDERTGKTLCESNSLKEIAAFLRGHLGSRNRVRIYDRVLKTFDWDKIKENGSSKKD